MLKVTFSPFVTSWRSESGNISLVILNKSLYYSRNHLFWKITESMTIGWTDRLTDQRTDRTYRLGLVSPETKNHDLFLLHTNLHLKTNPDPHPNHNIDLNTHSNFNADSPSPIPAGILNPIHPSLHSKPYPNLNSHPYGLQIPTYLQECFWQVANMMLLGMGFINI